MKRGTATLTERCESSGFLLICWKTFVHLPLPRMARLRLYRRLFTAARCRGDRRALNADRSFEYLGKPLHKKHKDSLPIAGATA